MQNLSNPIDREENVIGESLLPGCEIFDDKKMGVDYKNKRTSVRYVRKDITVFMSQPDIFGSYSLFGYSRAVRVRLLDISSRGVLIAVPLKIKLKINQKIKLTLIFNSNKKFEISATVMRQLFEGRCFFGIKFNEVNDELADHLLESQTELVFK